MATKRMFSMKIIDADAFLDMPLSTQALYFHLSMRADDDGFIGNHRRIMRTIGSSNDELKLLLTKNFIIPFESGVCVIKHWKMHNYIQKDRYHPTTYLDEKAQLSTKKNNAYTLKNSVDTKCVQNVDSVLGLDLDSGLDIDLEEHIVAEATVIPKELTFKDFDNKYIFNLKEISKFKLFDDIEVNDLFEMLLIQRTKLKKPAINSKMAITTIYNKLKKLGNSDCIFLLKDAIEGGWKTIYPKDNNNNKPKEELTYRDV